MAVPRLLAIAPDGWYADSAYAAQLAKFRKETVPLGASAAVYLRAHGWTTAEWLACLAQLERPRNLRIGITLPVDAELPDASETLCDAGVDFVHLTERDADRPLQVWQPLQLSRVCHDPSQARRRLMLGADWLVVSPILATPSKPDAAPLGLDALGIAARAAPGRIIALGGIDATAVAACLAAGAVGVAVQRAAWTNAAALARALADA
jgi:thiamine monophosphate synthase